MHRLSVEVQTCKTKIRNKVLEAALYIKQTHCLRNLSARFLKMFSSLSASFGAPTELFEFPFKPNLWNVKELKRLIKRFRPKQLNDPMKSLNYKSPIQKTVTPNGKKSVLFPYMENRSLTEKIICESTNLPFGSFTFFLLLAIPRTRSISQ